MASIITRAERLFGIKRTAVELINKGRLSDALELCADNSARAQTLIQQYNPDTHKVNDRKNKKTDVFTPNVITETKQKFINDVETTFLYGQEVGKGLKWRLANDTGEGEEKNDKVYEAWNSFMDIIRTTRNDSLNREMKTIAGSEAEAAKIYWVSKDSRDPDKMYVRARVLANSKGDKLNPLIDHLGNMQMFAHGYTIKEGKKDIPCYDVYTAERIWHFRDGKPYENKETGQKATEENLIGLIPIVYVQQDEAWSGAQNRLDRREELKSAIADVTDKNSDPDKFWSGEDLETLEAKVKEGMMKRQSGGNNYGLTSVDNMPRYLTLDQSTDLKKMENEDLTDDVLTDTYTPDMRMISLLKAGDLSGKALQRLLFLGYIKRGKNIMIYEVAHNREISIIKAILSQVMAIALSEYVAELDIRFSFAEPFEIDKSEVSRYYADLYDKGLLSRATAIAKIGEVDDVQAEIELIDAERLKQEKIEMNNALMGEM